MRTCASQLAYMKPLANTASNTSARRSLPVSPARGSHTAIANNGKPHAHCRSGKLGCNCSSHTPATKARILLRIA